MTKLNRALDALNEAGNSKWKSLEGLQEFAREVYAELTAPRTEAVEVKRWAVLNDDETIYSFCKNKDEAVSVVESGGYIVELTGSYNRPIPDPPEWEGEIHMNKEDKIPWVDLDGRAENFLGKRVIVTLAEE